MDMCLVTINPGDRLAKPGGFLFPVTYFPFCSPPATDCPPQEAELVVLQPGHCYRPAKAAWGAES